MSTNPTVGQLALVATSIIESLTEEQAKCFIRKHKIRSNGKLKSLVGSFLQNKSLDEIAFICAPSLKIENVAEEASNQTNEEEVVMENKEIEVVAEEASNEVKVEEVAKSDAPVEVAEQIVDEKPEVKKREIVPVKPGPRGFRFGPVWIQSIKSGTGVALMEINRNKLIAHALSLDVDSSIIDEGNADTIAKSISDKL